MTASHGSIDRRAIAPTAGATAGVIPIAGCGQASESTEAENSEADTDESETSSGNDDSTGGGETPTEELSEEESGDSDGASFDLDLTGGQFPDAFESLVRHRARSSCVSGGLTDFDRTRNGYPRSCCRSSVSPCFGSYTPGRDSVIHHDTRSGGRGRDSRDV